MTKNYDILYNFVRSIADECPPEEVTWKDDYWGNESDAEEHGYDVARWNYGSRAQAILDLLDRADD